jgi:YesN/AraC family two-component response regulator
MLIEDEPNAMERYSSYISLYDPAFEIVAKAATYEQAKRLFAEADPQIIFSDIVIPGSTGLRFLEEVRIAGWDGIAVIISGYGQFSYAQQAIKLAVFDYLLKPVFQKDLEQVLERILKVLDEQEPSGAHFPDRVLPLYLRRALEFIDRYYHQEVTLGAAASYAGVSPAYLSSSFSKRCEVTFVEYLQSFRSEMAAKYLEETDYTLEEIADRVGFGDSSYLNRCFKRVYHLSPGQYRKRCRNVQP